MWPPCRRNDTQKRRAPSTPCTPLVGRSKGPWWLRPKDHGLSPVATTTLMDFRPEAGVSRVGGDASVSGGGGYAGRGCGSAAARLAAFPVSTSCLVVGRGVPPSRKNGRGGVPPPPAPPRWRLSQLRLRAQALTGTAAFQAAARRYSTVTAHGPAAGRLIAAWPTPLPSTTTPVTATVYFLSFFAPSAPSSAYTLNEPLKRPVFGV